MSNNLISAKNLNFKFKRFNPIGPSVNKPCVKFVKIRTSCKSLEPNIFVKHWLKLRRPTELSWRRWHRPLQHSTKLSLIWCCLRMGCPVRSPTTSIQIHTKFLLIIRFVSRCDPNFRNVIYCTDFLLSRKFVPQNSYSHNLTRNSNKAFKQRWLWDNQHPHSGIKIP